MTRVRLVLASDRVAAGERADATAAGVAEALEAVGLTLDGVVAVPDEVGALVTALREAVAACPLVLTSGGTGLSPRDVTPEATRQVIDREVPGLGEAMRAASRASVPTADLSRGLAGTAGGALLINLPGSPAGARECLEAVLPAVLHGLRVLKGAVEDCADDLGPGDR